MSDMVPQEFMCTWFFQRYELLVAPLNEDLDDKYPHRPPVGPRQIINNAFFGLASGEDIDLVSDELEQRSTLHANKLPAVCEQIRKYKSYLRSHADDIAKSYTRVASNFSEWKNLKWQRPVSQIILDVASGQRELVLGEPSVGLIIFGFDKAQRDSTA